MRRLLIVLIFLPILIVGAVQAQDNRSVFGERWDVAITDVDTAENRFHVTEWQDLNFTGTFRAGTRSLSTTILEDYDNITVSVNGTPLVTGCSEQPGTFCLTDLGATVRVRYVFPQPATDETVSVQIDYDVIGAIRVYEGGDQIQWQAISSDHDYPINSAQITVQLPAGFEPREGVDPVTASTGEVTVKDGLISVVAGSAIPANRAFSVRVQYPHDPNARVPEWQERVLAQEAFRAERLPLLNVIALALAALLGLGLPLLFVTRTLAQTRRPKVIVPDYLTDPPGSLPPALAGRSSTKGASMCVTFWRPSSIWRIAAMFA